MKNKKTQGRIGKARRNEFLENRKETMFNNYLIISFILLLCF